MVVGEAVFPADLCDKQTITFHGRIGLIREAAGFRPGAGSADPAAAAAKAKSMGMLCLKSFAEPMEGLQMLLLDSSVSFCVNELFRDAYGLQQNAPGILPHFLPACFQCAAVWGTGVVFAVCPAFVSGAHIPHIPARGQSFGI